MNCAKNYKSQHSSSIELRFRKSLAQEIFKSNLDLDIKSLYRLYNFEKVLRNFLYGQPCFRIF